MVNTVQMKIGDLTLTVVDLGESMNSQFYKFYESHFVGNEFAISKFKDEALSFFSHNLIDQNHNNYVIHDNFFNNFTPVWRIFQDQRRFKNAEDIWNMALGIGYEWENQNPNKRIHKGTPYYFWGVTCILDGDLEKGFLLMHQALEEDKETHNTNSPNTPANFFVTLDYEKQSQFFRPKVIEIADFIDIKLENYRYSGRGSLNLSDFKSTFLEEPLLRDIVFYFVFEILHLKKLHMEIEQKLKQNAFSSLLEANMIFDFCLIVENAIKNQNKYKNNLDNQTIRPLIEFLSSKSSLNLAKNNNLNNLKEDFGNFFSNTIQNLLSSKYQFRDGTSPQPIEEDLAITYGFRNFGAHTIEDQPVIYQNFDAITGRILNALFFSIEKLYV